MKYFIYLLLIIGLIFSAYRCQKLTKKFVSGKQTTEKEPVIPKVETSQLAKIILTPKTENSRISRDPFKPLLKSGPVNTNDNVFLEGLNNVKFLGVVKVNDEYRVLIQSDTKKDIFKKNELVHGYTIEEIQTDYLILKKGETRKKIKRGGEDGK